jgi:hypothetical protein
MGMKSVLLWGWKISLAALFRRQQGKTKEIKEHASAFEKK